VKKLLPASLKVTVPLVLLGFAVALSTLNLIYQVPRAERAVEEDHRERLLQELSRLQGTLEYLLLKGDIEGARREVAILASNRNYTVVALTDDQHSVIAATRRAWLGRPAAEVLPKFEPGQAAGATLESGAQVVREAENNALLGYARFLILLAVPHQEAVTHQHPALGRGVSGRLPVGQLDQPLDSHELMQGVRERVRVALGPALADVAELVVARRYPPEVDVRRRR
jgi:hypothetical protein